jgi:hypothetical protein
LHASCGGCDHCLPKSEQMIVASRESVEHRRERRKRRKSRTAVSAVLIGERTG